MATKNDVTGDTLRTKVSNKKYDEGWERIFGKKSELDNKKEKPYEMADKEADRKNIA